VPLFAVPHLTHRVYFVTRPLAYSLDTLILGLLSQLYFRNDVLDLVVAIPDDLLLITCHCLEAARIGG
jgi:hypothetical protein